MPSLNKILDPEAYLDFLERRLLRRRLQRDPNLRGSTIFPPGHFYSPLLDLGRLEGPGGDLAFDGEDYWEHVDLRFEEQKKYLETLLEDYPPLPFPEDKSDGFRYFSRNGYFGIGDAFALSSILRKEKPRQVVEVGSGFSSAVMLDTLRVTGEPVALTFVEPFPERLDSLLSEQDRSISTTYVNRVQEVPFSVFEGLEEGDVLFVDSSHVAKVGSDVTHIFLRILPRLKAGVLVHFHDIFYPESYPKAWLREGRAWNESLILRAFLIDNPKFEIVLFNSFACRSCRALFEQKFPAFLDDPGGSIWLRKSA